MFCLSRILIVGLLISLMFEQILVESIKVNEESKDSSSSSSTTTPPSTYRLSRPNSKHPTLRVPTHLQDVRKGFVDDDAGDVIHIIEPPQHFQHMKRKLQDKNDETFQWQPPQPPVPQIPLQQKQHPQRRPRPLVSNVVPKVKYQTSTLNKVAPASTIVVTLRPQPIKGDNDLLTQETRNAALNGNHVQLPMEILASVRKTERLMHQRQRPKLPYARQRLLTKQTHTLLMEKAYEQQQYQRGKEHRLRAALMQQLLQKQQAQIAQQQQQQQHLQLQQQQQQQHQRTKRTKRELRRSRQRTAGAYDVAQGLKLVAHIGELLKNAALYLPDEVELLDGNETTKVLIEEQGKNTSKRKQAVPLIVDRESLTNSMVQQNATKCGKISDSSSKNNNRYNNNNNNNNKCLVVTANNQQLNFRNGANVNATNAAARTTTTTTTTTTTSGPVTKKRRFTQRQRDNTLSTTLTNASKSPSPSQQQQQQQQQQQETNHKKWQQPQEQQQRRRSATTTTSKSTTTTASTTKKTTNLPSTSALAITKRNGKVSGPNTKSGKKLQTTNVDAVFSSSSAEAELLYDDVMTNIRNMLQLHELPLGGGVGSRAIKIEPESQLPSPSSSASSESEPRLSTRSIENSLGLYEAPPIFIPQAEVQHNADYRHLNAYLMELKKLASQLPTVQPAAAITNDTLNDLEKAVFRLNLKEYTSSTPKPNWYLINGEGKIYETTLQASTKPTATIFHSFPDIPNDEIPKNINTTESESKGNQTAFDVEDFKF